MLKILCIFLCIFALNLGANNLKIATFNTENLFDGKIDGSEYSEFKNGSWGMGQYTHKLNQITTILLDLNADIIALQEIENEGVLKDLAQKTGYKFYKFATLNSRSPVGLGFLSRLPFTTTKKFIVDGVKTRPILMVCVDFKDLCLFNAHLPAYKNDISQRKKAANTLINAAKNRKKSIILGDLNSQRGYGFLLENLTGYKNLWDTKSAPTNKNAIDHILLSDDLFDTKKNNATFGYKNASFNVFKARIKASDHSPLYASLTSDSASFSNHQAPPQSKILNLKNATSVDEIYKSKITPHQITLTASFCDNHGCALSDENGRGIYAYKLKANEGDKLTLIAKKTSVYKGNLELRDYEILNNQKATSKPKFYSLKNARSGDVLFVKLNIQNGYAKLDGKKYKIYSLSGKKSGKQKAQKAMFWIFEGQKELIIK